MLQVSADEVEFYLSRFYFHADNVDVTVLLYFKYVQAFAEDREWNFVCLNFWDGFVVSDNFSVQTEAWDIIFVCIRFL